MPTFVGFNGAESDDESTRQCLQMDMTSINCSSGLGNVTEQCVCSSSKEIITGKDASWILTSAVIIFTMQTGFGLLEAGFASPKSETNIMVKNALDVVFGGITYWACGFGFSFGTDPGSNAFIGIGSFFVHLDDSDEQLGFVYALFLFQLSFATTSTTIVSGAMVERTKLIAYNCFSMLNTFIYCIPAHWLWAKAGFLFKLGALDIAGCGPVHLVGGVTGLVATIMIGPRASVTQWNDKAPLPSPLKSILGMFMLWWGWLRFNSGSVFIVSTNSQWRKAVRAAVNTIVSSMGGGVTGVIISLVKSKCLSGSRYDIGTIINGVLGSLVSVTAICTLCQPWEAFVIGCIGVILATVAEYVLFRLRVDDPIGVFPVHAVCAIWGLLSVGLFLPPGSGTIQDQAGLFKTGQWYMLGVQTLTVVTIAAWTLVLSSLFLKVIDLTIGLRLSHDEELLGADVIEHGSRSLSSQFSLESLASSSNGTCSDDFQKKALDILKDLLGSCQKNEMEVAVRHPTSDSMTLEFRLQSTTSSVDSGIQIHM